MMFNFTVLNREARQERKVFKNFLAIFAHLAVKNSSFLILHSTL